MVLKIGPAEMAAVILWGITLIGSLSSGSMLKGVIAGLYMIRNSHVGMRLRVLKGQKRSAT